AAGLRMREREDVAELLQRELPEVALVLDEFLQHRERDRPPAFAQVLDRAQDRRDVRERGDLGEEAPELELRVHALAHAPVALEEEAVAEEDRRVALLDRG